MTDITPLGTPTQSQGVPARTSELKVCVYLSLAHVSFVFGKGFGYRVEGMWVSQTIVTAL